MKRISLIAIILITCFNSQAFTGNLNGSIIDTIKSQPKDKCWKLFGTTNLSFNQISFSNWAPGGEDAFSGTAGFNLSAFYRKNSVTFENQAILIYGMIQSRDKGLMKMEDRLEFNSKLNYKAIKYWNYSLLYTFKSQFAPGFAYPDRVNAVSRFFAPAYSTLSLGMDFVPNRYISLFMSPISGKFTFVLDQKLADKGTYGVKKAILDEAGLVIRHGEPVKPELGMAVNTKLRYEIMKNIIVDSRVILYDAYMDEDIENRWNVDVDFETTVNFVINSMFSTTFNSRFLYDDNIMVPLYKKVDGVKVPNGKGPRLQIKQAFGIGMVMKLGGKKKAK